MKTKVLVLTAILLTNLLYAQTHSGVISFMEKRKLNFNTKGADDAILLKLPKDVKQKKQLYFNEFASLYRNFTATDAEDLNVEVEGNVQIKMVGQSDDNLFFNDLKNGKIIEQVDFMGRIFLIEAPDSLLKWKITGNNKTILGYTCKEANAINGEDTIQAWFTTDIKVSSGPHKYYGLPGIILEVNINNDKLCLIAEKVELKNIADKDMPKPSKGRKVTRQEFEKIREEKLKEMGASGGNTVIKIRTN